MSLTWMTCIHWLLKYSLSKYFQYRRLTCTKLSTWDGYADYLRFRILIMMRNLIIGFKKCRLLIIIHYIYLLYCRHTILKATSKHRHMSFLIIISHISRFEMYRTILLLVNMTPLFLLIIRAPVYLTYGKCR